MTHPHIVTLLTDPARPVLETALVEIAAQRLGRR